MERKQKSRPRQHDSNNQIMDGLDRIQDKILITLGRNRLTRKCILTVTQTIQMIESHERQIKTTHNEVHRKIQGTH